MKKKYLTAKIIFLVFIIIDLILCYFVFFKKEKIENKTYENSYIKFEYTSDYSLKEVSENEITLGKNKESGEISIIISELDDEVLKRDPGFIINSALEEFEDKNENYFSNYYGTYELDKYVVNDFLYDDGKNQIDLNYILSENKLVLISYVNQNNYFDLYEENVLEIIKSIEIL